MARLSKISKLPRSIREDLNERLDRNDTARSILEWLNAVPAVQEMLKVSFNSDPINGQNITNWRRSGFAAWQLRHDFMGRLEILQNESEDLTPAAEKMADHAAQLLSIHFALLLSPSSGSPSKRSDSEPTSPSSPSKSSKSRSSSKAHPCPSESICGSPPSDLKSLCDLTRAVVSLRRSDFYAARLKLLLDQSQAKSPQTPTPEQKSLAEQIAEIRSRRYEPSTSTPAPVPLSPPPATKPTLAPGPTQPSGARQASQQDLNPSQSSALIAQSSPNGSININQDIPTYSPDTRPPADPALGDLTPALARWLLKSEGLAAARLRYDRRERYLPADVQVALKARVSP